MTEFVKMNKPRECSYSSKPNVWGNEVTMTQIIKAAPAHNIPSRKPGAECNGITPRQLRAVMAMIVRRCDAEGWRDCNGNLLTPDSVTLYDVNRYIIFALTNLILSCVCMLVRYIMATIVRRCDAEG